MAKVSVKVQYKDDIRRVSFEEKPSYNALFQLITNLFADAQIQNFTIKYTDDEGDLISITNDREIAEAWEFAKSSNNLLKLKLATANVKKAKSSAIARPKQSTRTTHNPTPRSTTTTTSTPTEARPITDVPAEIISNFIDKVLGEVKKLQDATPEVKEFLSMFSLEELVQQFQPVLQQFTSEGYPAQLYQNRSAFSSSVEQEGRELYTKHMIPILSAFGVSDFNPSPIKHTPAPSSPSNLPTAARPTPNVESTVSSVPTAAAVNVYCNLCNNPIQSTRHKCTDCIDYNLCDTCFPLSKSTHSPSHTLTKMVYKHKPAEQQPAAVADDDWMPNSPRYSDLPTPIEQVAPQPVAVVAPVPVNGVMSSRLVKDVTIEDGTQVETKSKFTKVWRMKNNGTLAWAQGTRLVFVQGDLPCGDVERVELEHEVGVDQETDVKIDMIAPARPGRYISNFRLEDKSGNRFGHRIWVDIVVVEPEPVAVVPVSAPVPVPAPVAVKEEQKKEEPVVVVKDENEEKLEILESMGFCDRVKNKRLLVKNRGDIVYTVHELMGYL